MNPVRRPWEHRTDQRLSCRIEQHGVARLSDTDLLDHGKESVEAIGGFDGADDRPLMVVENRHGDIDGLFRGPKRSVLTGNQITDEDMSGLFLLNLPPPPFITEIIPIRLGTGCDNRAM